MPLSTPKGLFSQDVIDAKVRLLFPYTTDTVTGACRECGPLVGNAQWANHAVFHMLLNQRLGQEPEGALA